MSYQIKVLGKTEDNNFTITKDEISNISYYLNPIEEKAFSKTNSSLFIKISGRILKNAKDENNTKIYENNINNFKKIMSWANSSKENEDYKTIEIDIFLNEDQALKLNFSEMFVYSFYHEINETEGNTIYTLKLKQKFNKNLEKLKIM